MEKVLLVEAESFYFWAEWAINRGIAWAETYNCSDARCPRDMRDAAVVADKTAAAGKQLQCPAKRAFNYHRRQNRQPVDDFFTEPFLFGRAEQKNHVFAGID